MTVYHVDAAEVATAAANSLQTAEAIRASVAAMMTQLVGLEASWGGAAASSFQGVIAQWHTTQAQVEVALEAVSNALSQASATYTEAESAATSLFAGG